MKSIVNKAVLPIAMMSLFATGLSKASDASIYVQGSVGTQGVSVGASYYFKNIVGIRGVFDYVPGKALDSALNKVAVKMISNDSDEKEFESEVKTTMYDYGFDLSVRPFMGSFRVDAGFRVMDYRFKLHGASVVTNALGMYFAYKGDNELIIAKGVKPYIGLGWDFNPVAGLFLGFDIGVIYTGKWKATSITPELYTDAENFGMDKDEALVWMTLHRPYGTSCAYKDIADMEREPNKTLSGGVGKVAQFWPVLKFNIGYKFNVL